MFKQFKLFLIYRKTLNELTLAHIQMQWRKSRALADFNKLQKLGQSGLIKRDKWEESEKLYKELEAELEEIDIYIKSVTSKIRSIRRVLGYLASPLDNYNPSEEK